MKEKITMADTILDSCEKRITRRGFIATITTFALMGLARTSPERDDFIVKDSSSDYLYVNGWVMRSDDIEKIENVS